MICHGIRAPTSHGICGMQMKFRAADSRRGRSGFPTRSLEYKGILRKYGKPETRLAKMYFPAHVEAAQPSIFLDNKVQVG